MKNLSSDAPHTDIRPDGWISRFLPGGVRPYALLMRLDRPIGTWLLLLPGWWAIVLAAGGVANMNSFEAETLLLFGAGAVIMRGAGCVINDLWDRRIDSQVGRTQNRPLASGAVKPWQAIIFLAVLLAAGLLILCQLSLVAVLLGFLAIPLIVVYPLAKRFTWWPQLVLGLIFNFGALMGWAAINATVDTPALLLYAGGVFWTLGYDTIYAHQDKEDDLIAGIKSTALKFGAASKKWVSGFYSAAEIFFLAAFVAAGADIFSLLTLAASGLLLARQVKAWDCDDTASSLAMFRANRNFGLLLLLAAAL